MRINNIYKLVACFATAAMVCSCSDEWLEPQALSFYTPENSLVDADGLYAALLSAEVNMRDEYYGDNSPIVTEMVQSDIVVDGTTDKAGPAMNMDVHLLPDASLNATNYNRVGWYWTNGWDGIKYANLAIAYVDQVEWSSDSERCAFLGAAYFQRCYNYYKLVHQFGDVPYIDYNISEPQVDFNSSDRWGILRRLKNELEYAYEWVPWSVERGTTSKGACGMLLMKVCIELGDYDRAIEVGNEIVIMHPLMTERFGTYVNVDTMNLMHDLHSVDAKSDMSNTEGIMYVVSYPNVEGSSRTQAMRNAVCNWVNAKTPAGVIGTSLYISDTETRDYMDINEMYGQGIGRIRPTWYSQYTLWDDEPNDLRGVHNRDSWVGMSDLHYNGTAIADTEWYGTNIQKPVNMSAEDSIRDWFEWPHYKVFVPDPLNAQKRGGQSPWYIYRSAETWLLIGEAYYWKGDLASAATALNKVRSRAGASDLTAADINIGEILDERARELYMEENRHSELVRISYTYANSGKTCELFGRTYSLDNFSGPGGSGTNVKEAGINFFWDYIDLRNEFYNKVSHAWSDYKMSVHHVLWPIPADAITANTGGTINQNIGYPGAETNITPLEVDESLPANAYGAVNED